MYQPSFCDGMSADICPTATRIHVTPSASSTGVPMRIGGSGAAVLVAVAEGPFVGAAAGVVPSGIIRPTVGVPSGGGVADASGWLVDVSLSVGVSTTGRPWSTIAAVD